MGTDGHKQPEPSSVTDIFLRFKTEIPICLSASELQERRQEEVHSTPGSAVLLLLQKQHGGSPGCPHFLRETKQRPAGASDTPPLILNPRGLPSLMDRDGQALTGKGPGPAGVWTEDEQEKDGVFRALPSGCL